MSKHKNKFKPSNNQSEYIQPINQSESVRVPIKGMHCRSCEILIDERLREIPEIMNVQVSYKKSEAIIHSRAPLDMAKINEAVRDAGYDVGVEESKAWISNDPKQYKDFFLAAVAVFLLYFVAKKLGIINLSTGGSIGNPSSLLVVLLIGLTAGVSTCMAMVGGLILGVSARHSEMHPEATPAQKFRPHLYFNFGRVASYALLGGLVGLVGKAFQLSGTLLGILTIGIGLVMLVMGLQLTEMFPRLSSGGLTLPSSVSKLFGIKKRHEKEYSHTNSMLTGALTFFLPCGFTQAMQLYAMSTGSFWSGMLILGTFALGTTPGLLGIGGLTSLLKGSFAKKFFKFTGILVASLAIFNIANGYNLTGWKIALPSSSENTTVEAAADPNVKMENGVQVVAMDQLGGGYRPNKFTIKKGIPVKWVITAKSPDACSASILASKIGVKKILSPGENVIEFTPKETGEIKFSCLMGMYTGKFIVVDGGSTSSTTNSNQASPVASAPTTAPDAIPTPTSASSNDTQIIKTTFVSQEKDIVPNKFTVQAGRPVSFVIDAKADGEGCMGSVTVPGLTTDVDFFQAGQTITFNFTPTKKGKYEITCGMGVPRGAITVV